MTWILAVWYLGGVWSMGVSYAEMRHIGSDDPLWNKGWRTSDSVVALIAALTGPLAGLIVLATGRYRGWRLPWSLP